MAYRLVISERAAAEINHVYAWYEERRESLGSQFLESLDEQFALIAHGPLLYVEIRRGIRRGMLARFPYSVFFTVKGETVMILAVVHASRNPIRWPKSS